MSYLLSWSIYLWDLLEGVCVEKNALQAEVITWIWYQQLFTQMRTFKKKMSPLQIERTCHAKVSAGIYYRQLFAKKENLQYKEMIEISRWSLDRSHPYGLWFIYWDPPKFRQVNYIKKGRKYEAFERNSFLNSWSTQNCFTRGHIGETSNTVANLSRGKKPSTRFFIRRFQWFSGPESCSSEYLETCSEKKLICRSVALVTRYDVISSMTKMRSFFTNKNVKLWQK